MAASLIYFASSSLTQLRPLEFIQTCATAGFEGLGLRVHPSPAYSTIPYFPMLGDAPQIRDVKRALADGGFKLLEAQSFYMMPDTDVAAMGPYLELSAELGHTCTLVQGDDPDWNRMRDNFARYCQACAKVGLTASVEFMPARTLSTIQLAVKLIEEAGQPNANIMVDPLHWARGCGQLSDFDRVDPKLLGVLQISDGFLPDGEPNPELVGKPMPPGSRRALPGEGALPLKELVRALPPDIPVSIEVQAPRNPPVEPVAWAKRALATTRDFLESLELAPA
ncbi:MAG TPA: sugar phosphate isomerase/epimerase [Chloroflexota bacterium]|nr:sugar phosphate isomerase/epimerase [Chloroflexota bacterium]